MDVRVRVEDVVMPLCFHVQHIQNCLYMGYTNQLASPLGSAGLCSGRSWTHWLLADGRM